MQGEATFLKIKKADKGFKTYLMSRETQVRLKNNLALSLEVTIRFFLVRARLGRARPRAQAMDNAIHAQI